MLAHKIVKASRVRSRRLSLYIFPIYIPIVLLLAEFSDFLSEPKIQKTQEMWLTHMAIMKLVDRAQMFKCAV